MDGRISCSRVPLSIALAALMLLCTLPSAAQDVPYSRELYDNEVIFQQLSGALQTHLEKLYGRKPQPTMPAQEIREDKSIAAGLVGGLPSLSMLDQVLVNDAAADATAQDTQSETAIVIGSGGRIIVGFNDSGSYLAPNASFTGWARSVDGGTSFADQGKLPTSTNSDFGDPVLARSASTGTLFLSTLSNSGNILQIFRSTDNGATFLAPVNGTPGFTSGGHDKEWIAVDNFAGTGYGNVYMAWRNFGTPNNGIVLTRSTNDGVAWIPSTGTLIATQGSNNVQGPEVAVGPDHSVYVVWYDQSGGSTTFPTLRIRRSVDQGVTWGSPVTMLTLHTRGVNGNLGLGFRTNTFPQIAVNPVSGNLYVAYADSVGAGDRCNVYFTQSTNNGATWSAPLALTGYNDQWQPAIAVRPDGTGLSVTWYDRRSDGANVLIERWGVNASIAGSTVTWGVPFKISGAFPVVYGVDPVVNSVYMGDYDQMAADNNYYYTTWGDNRDQSIAVPSRKNANVRFAKYPSGLFLEFAGYQISGGNGNGIVDVHECNGLQVTLKNNSGLLLTGVSGTLVSLTAGVDVFAATQSFPDLGAGGYGFNGTPFNVSVQRSFVAGTPIKLRLIVSTSGGSETVDFAIASSQYVFGTGSGSIVAGTTDVGNHGDDLMTAVSFPFPVKFYNETYTTANLSSNGNLQLDGSNASFSHSCPLPATQFFTAIMPYFQDLTTSTVGDGIFTLVSGTTPNRVFNIEWRAHTFSGSLPVNFEVRFFENSPNMVTFIYGTVATGGDGAAVGVQFGTNYAAQFSCNTASLSAGMAITAIFPVVTEGSGTCSPPTMTVAPASLSLTVPQNGSSGSVVKVSNTASAGSDHLSYSVGDYTGSLVLSSGATIPVEVRRLMGVVPEKLLQEEAAREAMKASAAPPAVDERSHGKPLRPEETAVGQWTPALSGVPSTSPLAVAPYVETFESGNFNEWLNEGRNPTAQIVSGGGEGALAFEAGGGATFAHWTGIRQDWSGGIQPSSVEFFVRPTNVTDDQGYVVLTTGASANTEVIWFFCRSTGKFYLNADLPSGDETFTYAAGTWYRVEFRDINWTTKTFNYFVNGSLVKLGVSFRNAGSVSTIDRMHLYNFTTTATARWDGIRVGGSGGSNAWLFEAATGGVVDPGSNVMVVVSVNASGLAPATYNATLVVSGNDPAHPSLTVPVSMTVTPAVTPTEYAVVSNVNDNSINIIDVQRNASYGPYLGGSLGTGGLLDVAITPDHRTALATSFSEHRVYAIDVSNPAVPAVLGNATFATGYAEDIAITGEGRFGVVTGGGGNTYVGVVNIATRTVVQQLDISPRQGQAVAVAPNGTVLVADFGGGRVHVFTINSSTGLLSDPAIALTVGAGPINVAVSPDGQTALVANYSSGSVSVLRITGVGAVSVTGTIPNIRQPQTVAFRPDGVRAYILQVFLPSDSIATLRVVGPGSVTDTGLRSAVLNTAGAYFGVDGMDIAYGGTYAYTGDYYVSSVGAVNLATNTLGAALPAGSTPSGVALAGQGGPAGATFSTVLNVFDNCNFTGLAFGTGAAWTPGYDAAVDQLAPPAPPVGAFDARLRVTSPANDFIKDYRGPNTGTKIWDVYYAAATACGNVTLSWNLAQLPTSGSLRLVDVVTGTLVNVDMRTQSSFTDTYPLGHLQIVYSLDAPYTKAIVANWNLLGLPNAVTQPYYLTVFPTATPGTLYGFNGTYVATDTLRPGKGYWLRFAAPTSQGIAGLFQNSTANALSSGWNMIAGPSCNVALTAISDPGGIIIPGTLYGFSGSYFLADSVKRGNGYWIRTTAAGNIGMSCGSTLGPLGKTMAEAPDVTKYPSIKVSDASGHEVTLYAGVKVKNASEMLSFTMPPVPPAGSFDARFTGDLRAIEGSEGVVRLQAGSYPITVTASAGAEFVLEEIIGTEAGQTHRLTGGGTVLISDTRVTGFRVRSQSGEEIPASFVVDQNYPNPFNPSTEIRYGIPSDATVRVVVYNALGQSVRTLVNEAQKAGFYRVTWQGDNDGGTKVGSGVYFYRVTAGDASSLKKMLLVK